MLHNYSTSVQQYFTIMYLTLKCSCKGLQGYNNKKDRKRLYFRFVMDGWMELPTNQLTDQDIVASPRLTRPDTRLPQSRVGGRGPYLRSLDHLGRSSEAKNRKNPKKVKCDGPTDRRTDKAGCRVAKHATKNQSFRFFL